LETLDSKPLTDFLNTIPQRWPLLYDQSSFNESDFDLTDMTYRLGLYNNFHLLSLYVSVDLKNSSTRLLYVSHVRGGVGVSGVMGGGKEEKLGGEG
jgi:hypothetical protein